MKAINFKRAIHAFFTGAIILLISGCVPRVAVKRDYDFTKVRRIGVLKFDSSQVSYFNSSSDPGNGVADEFVLELLIRDFSVIERSRLQSIIKEQDLSTSGRLDPATIKKLGRILGVDALILGTIVRYTPDSKRRFYLQDDGGRLREEIFVVNAELGISARMVDVETGMVVWAGAYSYDSFYMDGAVHGVVSALMNTLDKVLPPSL